MQFSLGGQVALVTGGSTGIGRGIVDIFIQAGAKVIIIDKDKEKGSEVIQFYNQNGHSSDVVFLELDLYKIADLQKVDDFAHEQFGRIDILVNCAGIFPSKPALTITEADWDNVLDLNLKAPFFLAKAVAKYMLQQNIKGSIINIASTAAKQARPGVAHYCSSKAGLVMLTRVLALELASSGIRVNAICPGLVETETLMDSLTTPELQQEHLEKIAKIPLKYAGQPEEIARGVLYLADSKMSSFVTGQAIYIDGGYSAGQYFSTFEKIMKNSLLQEKEEK